MIKFKGFLAFLKRGLFQLKSPANWRYIYLVFYGFTPNKGILYDFKKYKKGDYLTDFWRYVYTHKVNAKYTSLFNDKLNSYYFLKNFTDGIVPIFGIIDNGKYFVVEQPTTSEKVPVILKDKNGWGGFGVRKATLEKELLYDENKPLDIKKYSNFIAVPLLTNADYAKKIFPDTLNTIRILSAVIDGKIVNIRAIHRFGNHNTGSVDNFSNGGMSCNIDIASGIIDSVVYLKNGKKYNTENHPYTNERIKGIEIPNWNEVLSFVNNIHDKMKFVKYVGWDVALCNDKMYIIEANHISDIDLMQTHYPLKQEASIIEFFKNNFN